MAFKPVSRALMMVIGASVCSALSCGKSTVSPSQGSAAPAAAATSSGGGVLHPFTLGLGLSNSTPLTEVLKVCKAGNESGTFTLVRTGGTTSAIVAPGHVIANGTCEIVAIASGLPVSATVTVTESPSTDLQSASVVDLSSTASPFTNGGSLTFGSGAGFTVTFTNATTGSQGCTPGFWKQPQHLDSWVGTGFTTSDGFNATFGIGTNWFSNSLTLLEALKLKGGGTNAVARQGVAALLNAGKGFFPLTVAAVKARVVATYNGTFTLESTIDYFDNLNSKFGCPLS